LRSAVRERARQAGSALALSGPGTHGASIDLDIPLSPPFTTKATDPRTHAKQSGGLLDSDTFTGQYSQTRVQAAPGAQKAPEVKDNEEFGQQTIQASGKQVSTYHGKDNSLVLHLSTASFKSGGTRTKQPYYRTQPVLCSNAATTRSKSSQPSLGPTAYGTPPSK
jgi:hypothetical protein